MKKFIYILLLAFSSALVVTSCTEEAVSPKNEDAGNGGGATSDPKP